MFDKRFSRENVGDSLCLRGMGCRAAMTAASQLAEKVI